MQLSHEEIKAILPHRYPFLLVDKITELVPGVSAKGIKCVSANEEFFKGHFPQKAIMPGVLIIEALAQTGAIIILNEEEFKGKIVLFGGVKRARFKQQVVPGDVLELECEMTQRRGPVGYGKGVARVNGKIAASAEIIFAIEL